MKALVLILILLVSFTGISAQDVSSTAGQQVLAIHYSGLKKTKASYLNQILELTQGKNFDEAVFKRDIQRLRNLQYFSDVKYQLKDSLDAKVLQYTFKEKFTLLPIIGFDFSNGFFRGELGLIDYHAFGRGGFLKGVYQFYERHSFQLYYKTPYILRSNWGLEVELSKNSTIEPTFWNQFYPGSPPDLTDETIFYNVDRWTVGNGLSREYRRDQRVFGAYAFLREIYKLNGDRNPEDIATPALFEYNKHLFKAGWIVDKVDFDFHLMNGWHHQFRVETALTTGNFDFFWKIVEEIKWYKQTGSKAYLATRLFIGISENKATPFPAFVQDDYVNVRAVGNRVSRGSAEVTLNAEYRYTIYNRRIFTGELVLFKDLSFLRPAGQSLSNAFDDGYYRLSIGTGLRWHLKSVYDAILRLDFGWELTETKNAGVVIGLGHYF